MLLAILMAQAAIINPTTTDDPTHTDIPTAYQGRWVEDGKSCSGDLSFADRIDIESRKIHFDELDEYLSMGFLEKQDDPQEWFNGAFDPVELGEFGPRNNIVLKPAAGGKMLLLFFHGLGASEKPETTRYRRCE